MPSLPLSDFGMGITDHYVDGAPNAAKKLDNILLNDSGQPYQSPGIDVYNAWAPQLPPGNQSVDSMYYFDSTLFVKSGVRLYYIQDGETAWTTLSTLASKDAFKDSELGAKVSWSEWRGHLIATPGPSANKTAGCRTIKIYRNSSSVWVCVQAGLPRATSGTTGGILVSPTSVVGGPNYSYIWATIFYRTYTAKVNGNTVTFEDFGGGLDTYSNICSSTSPTLTNGTLTYTNGTDESYDTSGMSVRLYRTTADSPGPFYLVGTFALAASIVDSGVSDDNLGAELYAGAEEGNYNDPVPQCYLTTVIDNYGWFAAAYDIDGATFQASRLYQSKPGDIDSVPSGNFTDIEGGQKFTALSYAGKNPVVFYRNRCYRIEGRLDSFGQGFTRAVLISDIYGAVSQDVSRTSNGIFFPSERGFCYTDGFTATLMSSHLKTTYAALATKTRMSSAFNIQSGHVYFGVESPTLSAATGTNNAAFVLDTSKGSPSQGVFTTRSAELNFQPQALHYDSANDRVLVGDKRGYVFKLDSAKLTDPVVNTAAAYSTWNTKGVVYDIITCAFAFGSVTATKWVTKLFLVLKNLTGRLSLDLYSYNDDKTASKQMKVVRERTTAATGLHKISRWFPKGGLRCTYKQVQIKKGFVTIAGSDDYALCTVDNVGNTALLATGTWPEDDTETLVGHTIYFDTDAYATGWVISVDSGNTLTLTDPGNTLVSGAGKKWIVKGYPKTEKFELHGGEIEFEVLEDTFTPYADGGDGDNT